MRDLAELLDPALPLPIAGTEYRVECSAWHGLHLHQLLRSDTVLSDDDEKIEILAMLGPAYDQMVTDGVPWARICHAGRTAMLWFGHSPELGRKHWDSGGLPGNPIPPSPLQTRMGERLRNLFRKPASATMNATAH
ncbi:hypothetical protein CH304_00225 [Rhodococcus sp. 15-649-1-2]|nr:hypothetical protein [Rhodococcus sp. 15-649-1-2]OZE88031.1 hypothetical protein CH304_00225 [Rhodococcus sp. 15-649-1-2]